MQTTVTQNQSNSLEIPIISPSSPLVPLQIHEFVKDINVPIETKINTNTPVITGGNTGFFGYFKSFFQRFSQSSTLQKKQNENDNSSFQKLFFSGNGIQKDENVKEEKKEEEEEEVKEEKREEEEEEEEKKEEVKEEEEDMETEITKIILTTIEDPEIILRESLKGTKLYYFTERTEVPSQWV